MYIVSLLQLPSSEAYRDAFAQGQHRNVVTIWYIHLWGFLLLQVFTVGVRKLCPNNFVNNDGVKELSIIPAF